MLSKCWLKVENAKNRTGFSRSSINRVRTPWLNHFVAYKIRTKLLQLRLGGKLLVRCYVPDLDALGESGLPKTLTQYVPVLKESRAETASILADLTDTECRERLWVSIADAAAYIDVSPDTIARLAVAKQPVPVPYGIRRWDVPLRPGGRKSTRYFLPDVDALLLTKQAKSEEISTNPFHR